MRLPRVPVAGLDRPVSRICCGTGDLGSKVDREASFRLLDAYVEAGGNFFDSAHCYAFWMPGGLGASDRTLGAYVNERGIREESVIATKGGHPDAGPDYRRPEHFLAPDLIARDVQECLERLQTGWIDVFYLHRDDGRTPVGEIVDALNDQVNQGYVRFLGASNWSVERTLEANRWAAGRGKRGFSFLQNQWSLATPTWPMTEDPTVRFVTAQDVDDLKGSGVAVAAWSATATGYFATNGTRGEAFKTQENEARLQRAEELARKKGVTANQIAVAWLLAQPIPTFPILGATKPEHLRDGLAAAEVELSEEERNYLASG